MTQIIAGVAVTRDDGTVAEYRFSTQANRARFESILRFESFDDEKIAVILQRYDAYVAASQS